MTPALDTMPARTVAGILDRVIEAPHPKLAKPAIAGHFQITLSELDTLVNRHGYPDKQLMRKHRDRILEAADQAPALSSSVTAGDEPAAPSGVPRVALTRLRPDPNNIRDELTGIEDLAASIQEVGLLQPIVARTEGQVLYVVAGHRRLAAVRHLNWTDVECVIRPSMKSSDVIAAMLIENTQRSDLDPIEEARGLQRLKTDRNCSDADLARSVGRAQPYVSSRLALLSLTPAQQDELRAGNMKLVEATYRGRLNSGKVAKAGQDKGWHLGPQHTLAGQVKARCQKLGHPRGRTVGGMGCGACWEHVIRANERVHLVEHSQATGSCSTCGALVTGGDS